LVPIHGKHTVLRYLEKAFSFRQHSRGNVEASTHETGVPEISLAIYAHVLGGGKLAPQSGQGFKVRVRVRCGFEGMAITVDHASRIMV
jgi:hypothetical protein